MYLTEAEYLALELPDDALDGLAAGTVDAAIAWASSQANGYLAKRHTLPLSAWGDDIRQQVAALATWQLMRKRGFQPGSGADESVVIAKDDAYRWLRDVANGRAELDGAVDATPTLDEEGPLASTGNGAVAFTFNVASGGSCPEDCA